MQYIDVSDVKDHIRKIQEFKLGSDVAKYMNSLYPGWLWDAGSKYDPDLKCYQDNWDAVCNYLKSTKKLILLVRKVVHRDDTDIHNYTILSTALNVLTKHGYSVRVKTDLDICDSQGCNTVIFHPSAREMMIKDCKPRKFKSKCAECN